MAKVRTKYVCQKCEYAQVGWSGKCPECDSWGSMVETTVSEHKSRTRGNVTKVTNTPVKLASLKRSKTRRISTKISEFDRVLGGGIVPGQVVLIAGEPGIGKSTILMQLAEKLGYVLYVSGEESINQIKIRADRLGVRNKTIDLLEETDMDVIINTISSFKGETLKAVVVDSIQAMVTSDLLGMAGSVGQVKECTYRLVKLAKSTNTPVFIVGHVTKEGAVAGPSVLMHLVDTVLWFEGERNLTIRLLRAMKNRFGPTDEVGIFEMEDKGLVSLSNPKKLFLTKSKKQVAGSAITSVLKGTRPILIEIQSLVVPTKMAYPKRNAQGIDSKRLEMLIAVLTRRCGLPIYGYDCFVNVTGGINVRNDPSSDLAVCLSIASAYFDKPLPHSTVVIGEVGLTGEVREVISQEKRIKEVKRLGYRNVITNKEFSYLQQAIKNYIK